MQPSPHSQFEGSSGKYMIRSLVSPKVDHVVTGGKRAAPGVKKGGAGAKKVASGGQLSHWRHPFCPLMKLWVKGITTIHDAVTVSQIL